jgi:hypothetical protein
MESARRAEELLDVVRVLLLVQGAILLATTIEALIWSIAFPGASGVMLVLTAATAAALLVSRARLRAGSRRGRRTLCVVESVLVVTIAIDTALAIGITASLPPPVALLTRFVLPLTVIALLRRTDQVSAPHAARAALEVAL